MSDTENPFEPEETESQQLNRIGKMIRDNVDRKMREKIYTQAEVDALIAGAVLAAYPKLARWLHHKLSAAQNLPWEEGDTCPDCDEAIREEVLSLLIPDAARLALEERDREVGNLVEALQRAIKDHRVVKGVSGRWKCDFCSFGATEVAQKWHFTHTQDCPFTVAKSHEVRNERRD